MIEEFFNIGEKTYQAVGQKGNICIAKDITGQKQFSDYMNYLNKQLSTPQRKRLLVKECNYWLRDQREKELARVTNAYRRKELK